jgi:hypothetical protein
MDGPIRDVRRPNYPSNGTTRMSLETTAYVG